MSPQRENVPHSARAVRWITHDHPLREMATAEDGFVGVIVNTTGSVYVIYPLGGGVPKLLPITDGICVSISGDGCFAAVGQRDGSISVWDVAQSQRLFAGRHGTDPINSVSLSASGVFLASASERGLQTWDISEQIIEARKYITPEALRAGIHREQAPSRSVFLTGPEIPQGSQASFEAVPPLLWAAECIGRELARAGLGLISTVHRAENLVAIRAFLAEWELQGKDGRAALLLVVNDGRIPASLPGGQNVEIGEEVLLHALSGIETVIVLGGTGSLEEIPDGTSSEKPPKQIYRVPVTRQAVVEVFGSSRPTNAEELWEKPIESREDAEHIASDLLRRIAGLAPETLKYLEHEKQQARQQLDRVLEALKRESPEEALRKLMEPSLNRLGRNEVDAAFTQAVHQFGRAYEHVRATQHPGMARTSVMDRMVALVRQLADKLAVAPRLAVDLMSEQDAGLRIMGLAVAEGRPSPDYLDTAIYLIRDAITAFEQYHAMVLTDALLKDASLEQMVRLEGSLLEPNNIRIDSGDGSRNELRKKMFSRMDSFLASAPDYSLQHIELPSIVRYEDDPRAMHGRFVVTRGAHEVGPMPGFQIGTYPVTNRLFHRFVRSDQYLHARSQLFGSTKSKAAEPESWDSEKNYPLGMGEYPVTGISYLETVAFVEWLNTKSANSEWRWALPTEDMWELAARSPRGFLYPWGNAFERGKCNSAEAGLEGPSEVGRFPGGQSWCGCFDMAGNAWEFVAQQPRSNACVLRGGSYKNNLDEIKSCFRLQDVNVTHRAIDFGFRCAKIRDSFSMSHAVLEAKIQPIGNRPRESQRSRQRISKKAVKTSKKK
jgi:hypothetical protein